MTSSLFWLLPECVSHTQERPTGQGPLARRAL